MPSPKPISIKIKRFRNIYIYLTANLRRHESSIICGLHTRAREKEKNGAQQKNYFRKISRRDRDGIISQKKVRRAHTFPDRRTSNFISFLLHLFSSFELIFCTIVNCYCSRLGRDRSRLAKIENHF